MTVMVIVPLLPCLSYQTSASCVYDRIVDFIERQNGIAKNNFLEYLEMVVPWKLELQSSTSYTVMV